MQDIIAHCRQYALSEIETYGLPDMVHFTISEKKALELADQLGAHKDIVHIWICLIDLKLGQAFQEKRLAEHVAMSVVAADSFLQQFSLPIETHEQILHCIQAHHGDIPYQSLEAEICANADCYRFAHPVGFFRYLALLGKRIDNFADILTQAETKLDEKHQIVSLDVCKKQLDPYYDTLKSYIRTARTFI